MPHPCGVLVFAASVGNHEPQLAPFILKVMRLAFLAPIRFLWNATRGHRLAPWRSEYMRWRVETYSGMKAETLTSRDVLGFLWSSRWEFLSYLGWIARMEREVQKRA